MITRRADLHTNELPLDATAHLIALAAAGRLSLRAAYGYRSPRDGGYVIDLDTTLPAADTRLINNLITDGALTIGDAIGACTDRHPVQVTPPAADTPDTDDRPELIDPADLTDADIAGLLARSTTVDDAYLAAHLTDDAPADETHARSGNGLPGGACGALSGPVADVDDVTCPDCLRIVAPATDDYITAHHNARLIAMAAALRLEIVDGTHTDGEGGGYAVDVAGDVTTADARRLTALIAAGVLVISDRWPTPGRHYIEVAA